MSNFIIKKSQLRSQRKKQLYKLAVARSDISAAKHAAMLFERIVKDLSNDLYFPLTNAIVVCYSRPFSQNRPLGPLPEKWTRYGNARLQTTHDELIDFRDKIVAHSDLEVRKVEIWPPGAALGNTKLSPVRPGVAIQTKLFPVERVRDILDTIADILKRLAPAIDEEIEKLYGGMDLPRRNFELRFNDGL